MDRRSPFFRVSPSTLNCRSTTTPKLLLFPLPRIKLVRGRNNARFEDCCFVFIKAPFVSYNSPFIRKKRKIFEFTNVYEFVRGSCERREREREREREKGYEYLLLFLLLLPFLLFSLLFLPALIKVTHARANLESGFSSGEKEKKRVT